jgi:SpoVK/Ycf46/Vps4 family AAA+-type ATPase
MQSNKPPRKSSNPSHRSDDIETILKDIWGEKLYTKVHSLLEDGPKTEEISNLELNSSNEPLKKGDKPLATVNTTSTNSDNSNSTETNAAPVKNDEKKIERDSLIGQHSAMNALNQVVSLAKLNRERLNRGLTPLEVNLHCVFAGSPGTGKTTFARFFAQEIKELGLLKSGHLIEVSRAELIAEFTGQTAKKTADVVQKAKGGILFIDEAYSLKNSKDDSFGQECIDTLVKMIEDLRNEMIVILAGYTEEIRTFLHHNTGLKSRIPNFINFADYNDEELGKIFDSMLKKISLNIAPENRNYVLRLVSQRRKGRSFGNAREIRNIIESALAQQAVRLSKTDLSKLSHSQLTELVYSDFTSEADDDQKMPPHEIKVSAIDKIQRLKGIVEVKKEFMATVDYLKVRQLKNAKSSQASPSLHLLMSGNPGTGRTTTARLIGEYYAELGLLAQGQVIEADRSNLVAGFTGQTAIKTRDKVLEALGGILLISDTQALIKDSNAQDDFGQEAMSSLIKSMQEFKDKLCVIFVGSTDEISLLLKQYPNLNDMSKTLRFSDLSKTELLEIAKENAELSGYRLTDAAVNRFSTLIDEEQKESSQFSNAKFILRVLENSFKHQAQRILKVYANNDEKPSVEQLTMIEEIDLQNY